MWVGDHRHAPRHVACQAFELRREVWADDLAARLLGSKHEVQDDGLISGGFGPPSFPPNGCAVRGDPDRVIQTLEHSRRVGRTNLRLDHVQPTPSIESEEVHEPTSTVISPGRVLAGETR